MMALVPPPDCVGDVLHVRAEVAVEFGPQITWLGWGKGGEGIKYIRLLVGALVGVVFGILQIVGGLDGRV